MSWLQLKGPYIADVHAESRIWKDIEKKKQKELYTLHSYLNHIKTVDTFTPLYSIEEDI